MISMNIQIDTIDDYEMMDAESNVRFVAYIKLEDPDLLRHAWERLSDCGKFAVEYLEEGMTEFYVQVRDGEVKSRLPDKPPAEDPYCVDAIDVMAEIAAIIKG